MLLAEVEEQGVAGILRYLTEHGAWDLVSLAIALAGIVGVSLWLFVPRRRIPGLNVHVTFQRVPEARFPLRLQLEIRNFSGAPVLIRRAGFKLHHLRSDSQFHMHSETGECEVKFPGRVPGELCEPDCYLRQGSSVMTWVGLDPFHTEQEIQDAAKQKRVGVLHCSIAHVKEKVAIFELRTKC